MDLRKTPLCDVHEKLGAKMVEFGGWYMPVSYTSVIDEHTATRTHAGLFDISHMGEILVTGKQALDLLQFLVTSDLARLTDGSARYGLLCNNNGTVIDDLFVYRKKEEEYMVVVNASNADRDFEWISRNAIKFKANVANISPSIGKIDLQGPNANDIFQRMVTLDLAGVKRFHFAETEVGNIHVLFSRTGYTGEDGFETYFDRSRTVEMWNKFMEAGKGLGLKPVGLGARDTLRIEACYSLYGHEINDATTPIEAGLGWAVKAEKKNFVGKDVLERQKQDGTERTLACFKMLESGIPREHYKVFKDQLEIGQVTSGTFSPTFKVGLGMALLKKEQNVIGNEIGIQIRDKVYRAQVVTRPFYAYNGKSQ